MRIFSEAIPADAEIGMDQAETGIGGRNISPDLTWGGAPEGTKSFAITVFDPDAPTGSGWWHWVVIDIPADVGHLPAGGPLPEGAVEKINDFGYAGYGGPYPPPGPAHRYVHTVHALDVETLGLPEDASCAMARLYLSFHELGRASFTGTFENRG